MIGIIGAMAEEIDLIINQSTLIKKDTIANLVFYQLNYAGKEFILVKSGVGKVNASIATTILASNYHVDTIISTGIAGGMAPLATKDICVIDKLYYGDVHAEVFGYAVGQVPGEVAYFKTDASLNEAAKKVISKLGKKPITANCLTSDSFITSMPSLPAKLIFCFEMESTAIAQVANHFSIKMLVLRYISDIVGHESQIENYNQFELEMAKNSSLITLEVVKNL